MIKLILELSLFKKTLIIMVASLLFILMFIVFPSKSSALVGDTTGLIPNNGSSIPWLVVTRPGGNGMDAPQSQNTIFVPISIGNTFDLTIIDACDNTVNDNSGFNNDTVYIFPGGEVSNVTSLSPGTTAVLFLGSWFVRCDSGIDSVVRVTMSGAPTTTIGADTFRFFGLRTSVANDSIIDFYVNRFRISAGGGIRVAFNSTSVIPDTSGQYTGIAYNNGAPNSWGWSTTLSFALPCSVVNPLLNQSVYFFDTDHSNTNGIPVSPFWQNNDHPMRYTIRAYNRQTDAFVSTIWNNQWLVGGQDDHELTRTFTIDPAYKYTIEISNINFINSIQVALPVNPIYATDPCPNDPPTGNINAICDVTPGVATGTIFVRKGTITDPEGDTMTMNVNIGATNSTPDTATFTNATAATTNIVQFNNIARNSTAYTIAGTVTDSRGGVLNVSTTAMCSPPANPAVNIDSSSCTTLIFTFTGENFNYTVDLLLNGVSTGNSFVATPSTQNFDTVIPLYRDFVSKNFSVRVTNNSFATSSQTSAVPVIGPCITASCTNTTSFSFSPSPEVNAPFATTVTYTLTGGPVGSRIAARNLSMSLATPGSATPSPMINNVSVGPGSTGGSIIFPGIVYSTSGSRTMTATGTGLNPASFSCTRTFIVASKPYVRFYGNDVFAGGGFEDSSGSCSSGIANARANGFSPDNSHNTYIGAASELAVFALNQISYVLGGSQQFRSGLDRLSFANTGLPATVFNQPSAGNFGGGFGTSACAYDYFVNNPITTPATVNVVNLSPLPDNTTHYFVPNGVGSVVELFASSGIANNIVIYVNGDVLLGRIAVSDTSISYTGQPWAEGSVPSLIVIASGSILVRNSITSLDGVYIAQPNGTLGTGEIHTCSLTGQKVNLPADAAGIVSGCASPLTVNGAFIAKQVMLYRSNGTVRNGVAFEQYNNLDEKIAEVFRFSPEIYMVNGGGLAPRSSAGQIDSIVSLPPAL